MSSDHPHSSPKAGAYSDLRTYSGATSYNATKKSACSSELWSFFSDVMGCHHFRDYWFEKTRQFSLAVVWNRTAFPKTACSSLREPCFISSWGREPSPDIARNCFLLLGYSQPKCYRQLRHSQSPGPWRLLA